MMGTYASEIWETMKLTRRTTKRASKDQEAKTLGFPDCSISNAERSRFADHFSANMIPRDEALKTRNNLHQIQRLTQKSLHRRTP